MTKHYRGIVHYYKKIFNVTIAQFFLINDKLLASAALYNE